MINLIPKEERKKMFKDFCFRILTVFFIILSLVFLIVSVLIFPYYLFSLSKKNTISEKLEFQKNIPMPQFDEKIEKEFKELNYKLELMEEVKKDKFILSHNIIDEILNKKTANIKIYQISYQNDLSKEKKVSLRGYASGREELLSFRLALEKNPNFTKINLPISNFIKGHNIQFNLDLIILE